MSDMMSLGEDAGRLLVMAMQPRLRPAKDPQYASLLKRFRTEGSFRVLTESVARGLGLRVLAVTRHGLVLGVADDGPFALRLSDYRSGLSVADRLCHGLIQLALAAYVFPRAEDLEEEEALSVRVVVPELVRYLVDMCQELSRQAEGDPALASLELQEAWRVVLSRSETRETADGRRVTSSLSGMVGYALERLVKEGLFHQRREGDRELFQATAAYRIQVRELAAHEAFLMIRRMSSPVQRERGLDLDRSTGEQ